MADTKSQIYVNKPFFIRTKKTGQWKTIARLKAEYIFDYDLRQILILSRIQIGFNLYTDIIGFRLD